MKIKVDKEEYERLLKRVDYLEKELEHEREHLYKNWTFAKCQLGKMMEDYFKSQCISVMVKRDKDQIIGEVRQNAMNNLFKEGEE